MSYGIEKSGLDEFIFAGYNLLGLSTFFTAGPKELKAWTYRSGMLAPETAGVIHTDFKGVLLEQRLYLTKISLSIKETLVQKIMAK